MWDRLLVDCNIATMDPAMAGPFGAIENGAIGIQDGRIVRVGRRIELAGYQASKVEALGGAWVTPGLIDCHTHLVFGGNRAGEFEQRLEGATYEEIARAGGGIASTVTATRAASLDELVEASRPRLNALMRGGVTTVEIKSGYGLDIDSELKMLLAARTLGESEPVRVERTLLALACAAARIPRPARGLCPARRPKACFRRSPRRISPARSTPFAKASASRRMRSEPVSRRPRDLGLRIKLHAEQLSNLHGAALAAGFDALSADHLEHVDEAGVAAMAAAGMVAVLLPGAFFALRETKKPPVDLLRRHGVPMAVATDCNPGTSPVLSPTLMMGMACTLFGLTPEEALAGMTRNAARALGLQDEIGTISAGKAADLCVWRISRPAELCYWIGLPGPGAAHRMPAQDA